MASSNDQRRELDDLFADLAHPNPRIQQEAYTAMVDDWPEESVPRLLSLLDQPDVSLRRAAVRGLGAFGVSTLQPLADLFAQKRRCNGAGKLCESLCADRFKLSRARLQLRGDVSLRSCSR